MSVAANTFTDAAGNDNTVSNEVSVTVDATAPTVSIGSAMTGVSGTGTFDVTVTFSEDVTGFDASDLAVINGSVVSVTGSGANYVAQISASGGGDIEISIPAAAAQDIAGNQSLASNALTVSNSSVEDTQKVIAEFLQTRANLLISSQPSLTGFLSGTGNSRGFNAAVTQGGGSFDFVSNPNANSNLWARLNGTWADETSGASEYMFGAIGSHFAVSPNFLIGGMVELDYLNQTDGASHVKGQGWMAGPYFVARLPEQPLFFEGRLLYGQTENAVSPPYGTYTDRFDTERMLAMVKVVGQLEHGDTTLMPSFQLAYTTDDQDAYTDALGNVIPAQGVALGQVELGLDFRHVITLNGDTGTLELTGGIAAIGSMTSGSGTAGLVVPDYEGGRAKIKLGTTYTMTHGGTLFADTFYDGIGASGFESYGLNLGFNLAF